MHRRLVTAALIGVSLAYLVMFAMVFDYSRWISNWAVCMFLDPACGEDAAGRRETPLNPSGWSRTQTSSPGLTLIPRVGICGRSRNLARPDPT
jgi:hypothetical protein